MSSSKEQEDKNDTENVENIPPRGVDINHSNLESGSSVPAEASCAKKKRSIDETQTPLPQDSNGQSKDMKNSLISSTPSKKQRLEESNDETSSNQERTRALSVEGEVDVCLTLNLKPGSRIEVKWDLLTGEGDKIQTETRWWGARLLPHDGRMYTLSDEDRLDESVKVPLRVLDYDPYTEGGFLDRSLADVAFLNDHLLYEVETGTHLSFRVEGSDWEEEEEEEEVADDDTVLSTSSSGGKEEALRSLLDSILQTALANSGISVKMKTLSAAQQCFMAEKIKTAKDTLVEKMLRKIEDEEGGVITADCVKKCMEEMGQELRAI